MTIMPPDQSWIRPRPRWAVDASVFACRVPVKDSSLVGILATGSIDVPVLPRAHARLAARTFPSTYSDCLERATIDVISDKGSQTQRSFYLHDVLRVSVEEVVVLLGRSPSATMSSPRYQARKQAATDRMHQYQRQLEAKQKALEDERSRIENDPAISTERKAELLRAYQHAENLYGHTPFPPLFSDLKIELEEVAFICPLARTAGARQRAVIGAVASWRRGMSRTGIYECVEVTTSAGKTAKTEEGPT